MAGPQSAFNMPQHATARHYGGGGFGTDHDLVIDGMSSVSISDARSAENGGGFYTAKRLQVSNHSVLSLQNVAAGNKGGGFIAFEEIEVAGNSTINISTSYAETGIGGGFWVGQDVKVSSGSKLIIRNATAESAGGFSSIGRTLILGRSTVSIQHATACHSSALRRWRFWY